jgi:hypothetical protein
MALRNDGLRLPPPWITPAAGKPDREVRQVIIVQRPRVGGATLWTPSQLTTALWLDAADAGTITTVSGAVSQWNDKSGNGRNAIQATAANRPALTSAGLNGLDVLTFDGINDSLLATLSSGLSSSFAFFAVAVPLRTNAIEGYISLQVASYSNYWAQIGLGGAGGAKLNFALFDGGQNPIAQQNTPTIGAPLMLMGVRNVTADTVSLRINGTQVSSVTDTTTVTPGYSEITIGGQTNQANRYANARIGEVIVIPSLPTTDAIQRIEGYAAAPSRWGLQGSLPADHPYKSTPPTI